MESTLDRPDEAQLQYGRRDAGNCVSVSRDTRIDRACLGLRYGGSDAGNRATCHSCEVLQALECSPISDAL